MKTEEAGAVGGTWGRGEAKKEEVTTHPRSRREASALPAREEIDRAGEHVVRFPTRESCERGTHPE